MSILSLVKFWYECIVSAIKFLSLFSYYCLLLIGKLSGYLGSKFTLTSYVGKLCLPSTTWIPQGVNCIQAGQLLYIGIFKQVSFFLLKYTSRYFGIYKQVSFYILGYSSRSASIYWDIQAGQLLYIEIYKQVFWDIQAGQLLYIGIYKQVSI